MREFTRNYRDFIIYKIFSPLTYLNLSKKIKNIEDFRYALGLVEFAVKKILFRKIINNETVRGR